MNVHTVWPVCQNMPCVCIPLTLQRTQDDALPNFGVPKMFSLHLIVTLFYKNPCTVIYKRPTSASFDRQSASCLIRLNLRLSKQFVVLIIHDSWIWKREAEKMSVCLFLSQSSDPVTKTTTDPRAGKCFDFLDLLETEKYHQWKHLWRARLFICLVYSS